MQSVIATKFGFDIDPVERKPRGNVTSEPAHIRAAVEGSLQRLGVEAIDLYYQHGVDPPSGGAAPRRRSWPPAKNLASASSPYSPLGRGFLTGTLAASSTFDGGNDARADIPRFAPGAMAQNKALVDAVGGIARGKEATPGQIALAWLLAQKPWIVPIPGTRKLKRLEENLAAADLELTAGELSELDAPLSTIPVQGARYAEEAEARTNL